MAYIGNTVENQGFTPAIDYFNGNGVTVTFTLSRPIASVAQVIVAIDNVIQNPNSSFTVAGNAITFSSAPLSGTNNIWVEYTSLITTYNAISQDPTVIGDIRATGGYLAEGDFGNSFVDGAILDYVTGNGRLTVGDADGLTIYNGGTASRTALLEVGATGNINIPGTGKRITGDFSNATLANRVAFQTSTANATTSLTVLPNGSSTTSQLNLEGDPASTTGAVAQFINVGGSDVRITSGIRGAGTYLPLTMYTGGSERLRIDTSGNVGIGTSSPAVKLQVAGTTKIGVTGTNGELQLARTSDGATITTFLTDGTSGIINSAVSTTFQINTAEAMRITSGGNLLIGQSSAIQSERLGVTYSSATNTGINTNNTNGGASTAMAFFTSGLPYGSITTSTAGTAYNTSSDYRLKENIAPMTGALAKVQQLKPCTYTWKLNGSDGQGFIAHELAEICPDAVSGEKDAVETYTDEDGNEQTRIKPQGIDTSFLVATLTAAIQEQQAIIEDLKARIETLEAK